jgi:hypothetical protein
MSEWVRERKERGSVEEAEIETGTDRDRDRDRVRDRDRDRVVLERERRKGEPGEMRWVACWDCNT